MANTEFPDRFDSIEVPENLRGRLVKRLFDVAVALSMAIVLAPLMVLIAALIMIYDGGDVLFTHERIGKGGRTFRCLKFRTMCRGADDLLAQALARDADLRREWDVTRKLRRDPRVIEGVGVMLRRSSLDELPQIFNVLAGDMSIVGPRPIVRDELDRYGVYRGDYLSVKPGLTGPWQAGERSNCSYEQRVSQDVDYVRNRTIFTDVRILFRTARKFVTGDLGGAY